MGGEVVASEQEECPRSPAGVKVCEHHNGHEIHHHLPSGDVTE